MKFFQLLLMCTLIIIPSLPLEASYYEDGKKAYYEKDYNRAVYYFKKAKSEYSNVEMQLLWADSENELGRVDHAMSANERVISLQPENFEVAHRLVEVYKEYEQREEIERITSSFDDRDLLPQKRSVLAKFLSIDYLKVNKLSTRITAEVGYDNYINLIEPIEIVRDANDTSLFAKTAVYASYLYSLSDKGGNWFIQTDVNAISKLNCYEPILNIDNAQAVISLGYKIYNIVIDLPVEYIYTSYSGKGLVQSYGINPTVYFILNSKYLVDFSMKSYKKRYKQSSMSIYDSNVNGFSSSLKYLLGRNYALAKIAYTKNNSNNENDSGILPRYIDSEIFDLSLSTVYRFNDGFRLSAGYMMKLSYFDEKLYSLNSTEKREDTLHNVKIGLSKDLSSLLKITSSYQYSRNITSYHFSNYDRIVTSIGLEYNY